MADTALWGDCKWGDFFWGGGTLPSSGQQGYVSNAKQDTVFLSESDTGAWGELVVDLSQEDTDLTNNTTYGSEANSARAAITSPRCLDCWVVMDPASDTGTILEHAWGAAGATQTFRLYVNGSNAVAIAQSHGDLTTLALPSSTTADEIYIQWSMEANPLTTGAGDAYRSELWIYNKTADTVTSAVVLHAVPTTSATGTLALGARYDGTGVFAGTIRSARIGEYFHDSTELCEDWIEKTTRPTLTGVSKLEGLVPTKASGFADDGQFHHSVGPVAVAAKQNDMRLVTPLVNELYPSPPVWKQDLTPVGGTQVDEWGRLPPGELTGGKSYPWQILLHHCVRVPVPPVVNRLVARVHVRNWTDGGTIRELAVRVYSMNRKPVLGGLVFGEVPEPLQSYYDEQDTTTDHTSTGTGEWLTFDPFRIARDARGFTWLVLAVEIHNGTTDADARYEIQAWSVEALHVVVSSGIGSSVIGGS